MTALQQSSDEATTLALALADELAHMQEQRDELACRLIQAMPSAIARAREESHYETERETNVRDMALVEYVLGEHDKLQGVGGHVFWTRAPVMVVQADVLAPDAERLRVVDPVHHELLGYVYRAQG